MNKNLTQSSLLFNILYLLLWLDVMRIRQLSHCPSVYFMVAHIDSWESRSIKTVVYFIRHALHQISEWFWISCAYVIRLHRHVHQILNRMNTWKTKFCHLQMDELLYRLNLCDSYGNSDKIHQLFFFIIKLARPIVWNRIKADSISAGQCECILTS